MFKGKEGLHYLSLFIIIYHCMYHNEYYHDVLVH